MVVTRFERSRKARRMAHLYREDALRCRQAAWQEGQESIRLRWRARQLCFDRHGPVSAMSEEELRTSAPSNDVDGRLQKIRDEVIRSLFAITLDLGTALELLGDPVARNKIGDVIGRTDDLIREVRLAILGAIPVDAASPRPSSTASE